MSAGEHRPVASHSGRRRGCAVAVTQSPAPQAVPVRLEHMSDRQIAEETLTRLRALAEGLLLARPAGPEIVTAAELQRRLQWPDEPFRRQAKFLPGLIYTGKRNRLGLPTGRTSQKVLRYNYAVFLEKSQRDAI